MSATDPSPQAPVSRRRGWLLPLLVASLAMNLVILGAVLSGHLWPKHAERDGFHRSTHLLPRSFFADLDRQRRSELAEQFRARKSEFREHRSALNDAATLFAEALEREPFDPQLAQSAVAEHADRSRQLLDLGAAVAADLVGVLTPEERRQLAEAIRQRLEQDRARRDRRSR